jgi:hypothetical protein
MGEMTTAERSPTQSDVTLPKPANDPPPREVIDIAEGPRGNAVTEVSCTTPATPGLAGEAGQQASDDRHDE